MSSRCGKAVYYVVGWVVFICEKVSFFAFSIHKTKRMHGYNVRLLSSYSLVFNMSFTQYFSKLLPLLVGRFFTVSTPPITNRVY